MTVASHETILVVVPVWETGKTAQQETGFCSCRATGGSTATPGMSVPQSQRSRTTQRVRANLVTFTPLRESVSESSADDVSIFAISKTHQRVEVD